MATQKSYRQRLKYKSVLSVPPPNFPFSTRHQGTLKCILSISETLYNIPNLSSRQIDQSCLCDVGKVTQTLLLSYLI